MIELATGAPGCGKSFYLTRKIVFAVRKGKPVVTNVPLRPDWAQQLAKSPFRSQAAEARLASRYARLVYSHPDLLQLLKVRLAGEGEGRGLMVIDETQEHLDSRTWDTGVGQTRDEAIHTRQLFNRFFQRHRHFGYDVTLATQHINNIDTRVVRLFEYHTSLRNLARVRLLGFRIFPFNLFVANTSWNDRIKSKCSTSIYGLDKKIATLYHTHALSSVGQDEDTILHPALVAEPEAC